MLFGCTLPWSVIGFWNAAIGFLVMRFAADPVAVVNPAARGVHGNEPITASTAITIFVRNEPPERVVRNLDAMMVEIAAAGVGERFHLYVLSDTSHRDVAAQEEKDSARSSRNGAAALGDVPPPHREHRVQSRQLLGLLPALG